MNENQVEELKTFEIRENISNFEEKQNVNPVLRQLITAAGSMLITICNGIVCGYSAILLPQLKYQNIKINKDQESWIASMAPLPMALGCIFSGWSLERLGRRMTHILGSILLIISWGFICFANSINAILLGRLLTGFCIGATGPAASCYMAEITSPRYRGLFLSTIGLGIAIGLFFTHLLGTFLTWKVTAMITVIIPVIVISVMLFVPESHVWYVNKGDFEKAERAFYWLRGKSVESKAEYLAILETRGKVLGFRETLAACTKVTFIKPLLILNLLFWTVQFSGNNAVIFYSVSIMQQTVPNLNEYASMLIIDVIRVFMSIVACYLTNKFNVRPLIMISGIGTALSLYLLSTLIYLNIRYLPLLALTLYIVLISVGLACLPWALCGELFPPATKGVGGGIGAGFNFLSFFVVVKTSPGMFEAFGAAGTFSCYGTCALLGTAILYFVLPETKGKTLVDIEKYFMKNKKNCADDEL